MIIKFRNQDQYVEPNGQQADQVLLAIQEIINQGSVNLHHIVVDGVTHYDAFESAISDHVRSDSEIVLVEAGSREWLLDLLLTVNHYVGSAEEEVSSLASTFQQGEDQIRWDKFKELLEGIQWLGEAFRLIANSSFKQSAETFSERNVQLSEFTQGLLTSLEEGDRTLTGDLLQYEILPFFQQLQEEVRGILTEGE